MADEIGHRDVDTVDRLPGLSIDRLTFKERTMTIHLEIVPILSLVAGIAILIVPRLLNYIVAAYLILAGLAGLFG